MTLNYLKKLDKIRDEMFNISLGLKEMFDFAMDCHDKQAVEKTIKEIKKIQKKCYKVIDRKRLNDNHGGTYRCYPGGDVDVYKPHTDRQNVIDIIDYFFINTFSSADEFNEKVSPKIHEHEDGESSGLYDYYVDKTPKRFYDANCWEQILRKQAKELIATDGKGLTQEKIEEINQEYGKNMKTNVENNYQTKIKKFSKLELAENRSIKAVVSFAGPFFLSVAGGIISYPVAINTIDEFKESDQNYNAIIENGLSDINERYENGILSQEEYNNEIDQLYSNSNAIEILKNSSSPLKYRYETSITLGSVLFVVSIANVLGALASVEIFANIEEARKRLGREMEICRLQNNIKDADLNPRIIYNYESEENGINYP